MWHNTDERSTRRHSLSKLHFTVMAPAMTMIESNSDSVLLFIHVT